MAGTFTHWMIVEEALRVYGMQAKKHPLFSVVQGNYPFVSQGAIGPDYPYLTELAGNLLRIHSWADRMHYENTGAFVACGIRNLAGLSGKDREICLSWLCGFATHLVADTIVHPVVNLAVAGLPLFNGGPHRRCEMTQDSWIYHEVTHLEIAYGNYVARLRDCSDPTDPHRIHPALRSFWRKTLCDDHAAAGAHFDKIDPDAWHRNVILAIGEAADPIPIFRHIGEDKDLVYKKSSDLSAQDLSAFVEQVKLPGGGTGHFKQAVFDKTVGKVVETWGRLFEDVEAGKPEACLAYLRNWDLDRGVDLDTLALWA